MSCSSCAEEYDQLSVYRFLAWPPCRVCCPRLQTCAQVLLTLDNLANRSQYVNAKNTFEQLLHFGAVPVVNENDTVAVQASRVWSARGKACYTCVLRCACTALLVGRRLSCTLHHNDGLVANGLRPTLTGPVLT